MEKSFAQVKPLIDSLQKICSEFEKTTLATEGEWKDARKDEFYRTYVSPYNQNNKNMLSTLKRFDHELQSFESILKSIINP